MKWKSAALYLGIAIIAMLMFGTNVHSFFLNLDPVTMYTDNTLIAPPVIVYYDAWQDNTAIAFKTPLTKIPTLDNVYGASHVYRYRTHLSDDRLSADVVATLVSPLDDRIPKAPAALPLITK